MCPWLDGWNGYGTDQGGKWRRGWRRKTVVRFLKIPKPLFLPFFSYLVPFDPRFAPSIPAGLVDRLCVPHRELIVWVMSCVHAYVDVVDHGITCIGLWALGNAKRDGTFGSGQQQQSRLIMAHPSARSPAACRRLGKAERASCLTAVPDRRREMITTNYPRMTQTGITKGPPADIVTYVTLELTSAGADDGQTGLPARRTRRESGGRGRFWRGLVCARASRVDFAWAVWLLYAPA